MVLTPYRTEQFRPLTPYWTEQFRFYSLLDGTVPSTNSLLENVLGAKTFMGNTKFGQPFWGTTILGGTLFGCS